MNENIRYSNILSYFSLITRNTEKKNCSIGKNFAVDITQASYNGDDDDDDDKLYYISLSNHHLRNPDFFHQISYRKKISSLYYIILYVIFYLDNDFRDKMKNMTYFLHN